MTPLIRVIVITHAFIKFQHHIDPVATTILALARPDLAEPRLLVVANKVVSTDEGNPLCHARILDALDVALEQNPPQSPTAEVRVHAQRMDTDRVAELIVADGGRELILGLPVFRVVHGVVGHKT